MVKLSCTGVKWLWYFLIALFQPPSSASSHGSEHFHGDEEQTLARTLK